MLTTVNKQRAKNFFLQRNRYRKQDDLPWVRIEELGKIVMPRPVVMLNGCFDLLHAGHMRLIFAAREKAATLLLAMDSDRRVRELKGEPKPILSWIERATALQYMPIDYLVEFDAFGDLGRIIEIVKPDLRVQGYDHIIHADEFPEIKHMFVRNSTISTSEIIRRAQRCPVS